MNKLEKIIGALFFGALGIAIMIFMTGGIQ